MTTNIQELLKSEGLKIKSLHVHPIETDPCMNVEDEMGKVTQLNGVLGNLTLQDGRNGKIILQIDLREEGEILIKK